MSFPFELLFGGDGGPSTDALRRQIQAKTILTNAEVKTRLLTGTHSMDQAAELLVCHPLFVTSI